MDLNVCLLDTNHHTEATLYDASLNSANFYLVQNNYFIYLLHTLHFVFSSSTFFFSSLLFFIASV